MPAITAVASVSITDTEALNNAIVRFSADVIDTVAQDTSSGRIRNEFKFPGIINGTAVAFYLDGTNRDDSGFLTVNARATVFASPVEGTVHYITLTRTASGWQARLDASEQVSSD